MDNASSGSLLGADNNAEREKFVVDGEYPVETGTPLPDFYGDDRLVVLPRDPAWFFAYWEITPGRSSQIRTEHGNDVWDRGTLILRCYDVSNSPSNNHVESCPYFDVEVGKQVVSWYVKVEREGRHYVVDLGLRLPDGRFISILRSNRLQLPTGKVSDLTDAQWMSVTGVIMTQEEWDRIFAVKVQAGSSYGGSAEFAKSMTQRWEFLKSVFSMNWFSSPGLQWPTSWPSSPSSWMSSLQRPPEDKKS